MLNETESAERNDKNRALLYPANLAAQTRLLTILRFVYSSESYFGGLFKILLHFGGIAMFSEPICREQSFTICLYHTPYQQADISTGN